MSRTVGIIEIPIKLPIHKGINLLSGDAVTTPE